MSRVQLTYKASNKKKKNNQPWWLDTLNFIARPQRAITGALANITDKNRKTTLLGGLWGGISGKEKKDFDEVLNNIGWKQAKKGSRYNFFKGRKGSFDLFDIVNFAGNVAFDPLTYLTLGGTSAVKSGARAMAKEGARQAVLRGINVSGSGLSKGSAKRLANVGDLIEADTIAKLSKGRKMTKELEERIAGIAAKRGQRASTAIENKGRAARFKDQNAKFNFDIPFTNISKAFGKKGKWTRIDDPTISSKEVAGAMNMFGKIGGQAANPDEIKTILNQRYGVDDLEKLTAQQKQDLDRVGMFKYSKNPIDIKSTGKSSRKNIASELESVLKVGNPESKVTAEQLATKFKKKELISKLQDAVQTINKNNLENNTFSKDVLESLGRTRFQQDMGGTSKLGDLLRPLNPFNKRTVFGNKVPLINKAAESRTEAENAILSQSRQIEKDAETLQSMSKGISEDEMKSVGFIIENKFPKEYGDLRTYLTKVAGTDKNYDKLVRIAQFISNKQQRYSVREENVGLLSRLRSNYFPHIQDFDAQEAAGIRKGIQENLDDPIVGKFIQQSSRNPYINNRKSFATLAEVDDAVAELKVKLAQTAEGTPEFEKITRQMTLLQNLFKRDPIKVFVERSKTAVRSAAMKALQNQFELDGLIIRNARLVGKDDGGTKISDDMLEQGYKKLNRKEANAIGLANVLGRGSKETILIDSDLYKVLTQSTRYTEVDAVNRAVEIVNVVTNMFKVLYTSAVPKHYWYNLVGSAFNNAMAGVQVGSYFKAAGLMRNLKTGNLSEKEIKIIEKAFDQGVLNQTGYADLVRPEILQKGREKSLTEREIQFYRRIDEANKKIVDNVVSRNMRRFVGDPVDNLSRLAHYIHVLETTKSTKQAADSVRKYLFNYNEVTQADRIIKVGLPFWNWMKNNIPLQIEKLIKEPRIAATYSKLREESFGEQDVAETPKYIQEGFLKLPFSDNKFYNPRLPLQDLSQLGSPVKSVMNALTPVAKAPIEYQTNYQIFSERPISYRALYDQDTGYFTNEDSRREFGKYANANLGILGDIWDVGYNYTKKQEEQKKWYDMLAQNLFGSTSSIRKE